MIHNVLTSKSKCQPAVCCESILSSAQTKHQLFIRGSDMHAQVIWEIAWRMQLPVLFINLVSAAKMPSHLSKILHNDCFSFLMPFLFHVFTEAESHPVSPFFFLVFLFLCNTPLSNPLFSCESILLRRCDRRPHSFLSMHPYVWLCRQPLWLLMWPRPLSVPIELLGPKLNRHMVNLNPQRRAFPAGECHHCTRNTDWVQRNLISFWKSTLWLLEKSFESLPERLFQDWYLQKFHNQSS